MYIETAQQRSLATQQVFIFFWDFVHKTSGKFVNMENASVVEVKFLRVTKWSKAVGTEMSTQLRIWGIL